jgi:hypothetical protein
MNRQPPFPNPERSRTDCHPPLTNFQPPFPDSQPSFAVSDPPFPNSQNRSRSPKPPAGRTAYLVEVTSLSPGLPPQRLPWVTAPQIRRVPCKGSFPRRVMADRSGTMLHGPRKQSLQDRAISGAPTRGWCSLTFDPEWTLDLVFFAGRPISHLGAEQVGKPILRGRWASAVWGGTR